jgi:TPP-dependent 2-oxoacid decarboxylase
MKKKEIALGIYLLNALQARGVAHIFGVPGDYILRFDKLIEEHTIRFINTTRENTAGYMADAYARLKGLGVVCVTYGVGLNLVNAVSQAYMESSPLVVISGAPGANELKRSHLLHHLVQKSAGPYENTQHEILKPITAYQALLKNPQTAAYQIQEALDTATREKKPVYIELPRDIVMQPIEEPSLLTQHAIDTTFFLKALEELFAQAKRPFIWVGHEVQRYGLAKPLLNFAEKWHIPLATTLLAKTTIDERHPLNYGIYQGDLSRPEVSQLVNESDAALLLGVIENDINTGIFTSRVPKIRHLTYAGEALEAAIAAFPKVQLKHAFTTIPDKSALKAYKLKNERPITTQAVFEILQTFVTDDMLWVADVGDCLFGASDLVLPENSFIANAYFSSLGFAVPGAVGAALAAPEKRVIALVGDGAFQMTGTELSTAVRYGLNPIVILFNNKGYGTERPILDGEYNDLVNWKYTALPELLRGGKGHFVKTEEEFAQAFTSAIQDKSQFHLLEIDLDPLDFSNAAKRFGEVVSNAFKRREVLQK